MNILALETVEKSGSLAALVDERVVAACRLDPSRRSAETLAMGLQRLLADVGWRPTELQLIAVAAGPGSFTGLRVGVTTAKTLAYSIGAEVIAVNTLEVIARQCPEASGALWSIVDAQRRQVYAARFRREGGTLREDRPTQIEDIDDWLETLKPGDWVSGPVLAKLAPRLPKAVRIAPARCWSPTAEEVGRLGFERHAAGQRDDLWQLVPQYYRKPAAEEKLEERRPPSQA